MQNYPCTHRPVHTQRWRRSLRLFISIMLVTTGACDSLLTVAPLATRVPADALNNPALAPVLVDGAIADFECAYSGYAMATGLLTGEFITSSVYRNFNVWGARLIDIRDYGDVGCAPTTDFSNLGTYLPLQIARFQAEDAYGRIVAFPNEQVPNKGLLLAKAAAYAGYSYALLGEGFCEIAIDGGPAMQPSEVLKIAEQRFTTAIDNALAAGNPDIVNMALIGRARVRLDLGKSLEAAADAKLVSPGYVKNVSHSTANQRRGNRVYASNNADQYISVDSSFRNLQVNGVPDPRVPVIDAGRNGNDQSTHLWLQLKYTSLSAPTPLATWAEAQLIIAEVEGGQAAVDAINRVRANWSLSPFSSADSEKIKQQVIEERRRQLFADGHRISDMLRLNLPWRTGSNDKGEPYGPVKCLPLMNAELFNNPNIQKAP